MTRRGRSYRGMQHPFREPDPGYLARVFAEEESAQCRFGTPIVDGDQVAGAGGLTTGPLLTAAAPERTLG